MRTTELVYSSHDRCEYLHREWIVQRALEGRENKTVFYIPFSNAASGDQQFSWGTFSWYLDRFRQYGLTPSTFFYHDGLRPVDAERFFTTLRDAEVVILGGGSTSVGMGRFADLGGRFFGNPGAFREVLRERQGRGKLTVGFSAGADQLCEFSCDGSTPMLGMVRQVIVTLHFGPGGEGHVEYLARRHPDCLVFGLPNDSGIAAIQGVTARGSRWQFLQFITDGSWDRPEDAHHIKTRQGVRIEHRYPDGRNWQFNGGDVLVRVFDPDGVRQRAWIKRPEVGVFHDHSSQRETGYRTLEQILQDA